MFRVSSFGWLEIAFPSIPRPFCLEDHRCADDGLPLSLYYPAFLCPISPLFLISSSSISVFVHRRNKRSSTGQYIIHPIISRPSLTTPTLFPPLGRRPHRFSVPHDRLFLDALERDLKREKMGMEPTTVISGEPALSFTYDPKRSLFEQFSKAQGVVDGEGELETAVRIADEANMLASETDEKAPGSSSASDADASSSEVDDSNAEDSGTGSGVKSGKKKAPAALQGPNSPFFSMFSIFEGSPTYKQRRKKIPKSNRRSPSSMSFPSLRDSPDEFLNNRMYGLGMGNAPHNAHSIGSHNNPYSHHPHHNQHPHQLNEPQLDRFGNDTSRMSAEDMFMMQARGDFSSQSNPDLVATLKEKQRRALEASFDLMGRPSSSTAPSAYMAGLSGPGVAGRSITPGYPSQSAAQQQVQAQQAMMAGEGMALNGYIQQAQGQRPHAEARHTFPFVNTPQQHQHRTNTVPHPIMSATSSPLPTVTSFPPEQTAVNGTWVPEGVVDPNDMATTMGPGGVTRSKVFVCPLFSCGRMFKRMEHLKRHLRTHTLERPFQCTRCKKKFARSDNLTQHMRTHYRGSSADGLGASGSGSVAGGADGMMMMDELEMDDGGNADVESSEDVDELEGDDASFEGLSSFVDPSGAGGMNRNLGALGMTGLSGISDIRMCEFEVEGGVQEVQGDEEGLVLPSGRVVPQAQSSLAGVAVGATSAASLSGSGDEGDDSQGQDVYFTDSTNVVAAATTTESPGQQWLTLRAQPSPAFSTSSMSSPQPRLIAPLPSTSYGSNLNLNPGAHQHSHMEYLSMSAPSHKAAFDHGSLYPPEIANSLGVSGSPGSSGGAGPIRRHRSATPSVGRFGEGIRRPYSTISDHGSNGSVSVSGGGGASGSAAGGRGGFHPYAVAAVHSAESSPMSYPVQLDAYDHTGHHHSLGHGHPHSLGLGHPRSLEHGHGHAHGGLGLGMGGSRSGSSHSRSSSTSGSAALQEQMHQMLSLEQMEESSVGAAAGSSYTHESSAQAQGYGQMYHPSHHPSHQQQQHQHPHSNPHGHLAASQPRTESPLPLGYVPVMGQYSGVVGMVDSVQFGGVQVQQAQQQQQQQQQQQVEAGYYGHGVAM